MCVCVCVCVCNSLSVCVCVCARVNTHMCVGVHQLVCIKRHAQQPSAKAYQWISELNQLIVVQQAVLILQWRRPGKLQHFFQFPAMCLLHGRAQFSTPVQEHNFLFSLAWPDIQFGFPVRCETTTASLGQDQVWNPSCVKQLMKTSGWESLLSHSVKFLGPFPYIYTKTWRREKKTHGNNTRHNTKPFTSSEMQCSQQRILEKKECTRAFLCMHCVYLALWTHKVLCGSFLCTIHIFIHSFVLFGWILSVMLHI